MTSAYICMRAGGPMIVDTSGDARAIYGLLSKGNKKIAERQRESSSCKCSQGIIAMPGDTSELR